MKAELDEAPAAPEVVALHPAVLARYEQQLEKLQESLASCVASGDTGGGGGHARSGPNA